ncbi:cytidyltransferase [Streptomyces sp. FBKL.4005]|nr:adenylyltransferase/cytidyltransferase family protein [Streptomyces sp. SID7810]OYP19316.1 cytidyltransferase [Streptomyces sp. FBKL.4005]CUW26538.1 Bifunctional protein HldE [Streptomyces reticuli]
MTRIGFAPGVYDLFHIGHLNILRQARRHCDRLIAGVTSDDLVERLKGRPPVVPLIERLEIVGSLRCVDLAVVESEEDKLEMWKQIGFHVIFKGDDWRGTPKWESLERRFAEVGVEVVYFPYTMHTSSTLLRGSLELLSRPERLEIPSAQLPEPLDQEGGHEHEVGQQQCAVDGKEDVLTAQE